MYACKQCGTGNPLDSSFCKKCGGALPENELAEARVKLNEMLEEGNNLFTDGRTDEAMLIAEAAVAANPSSHMAHSLKGLCHERMGQISEALECYEAAVGLNPDSSLDKVKVAALRNRLAQRVADAPEPNRRVAALMAGSAMLVVLVAGCLVAIGMNGRHDSPKVTAITPDTTQSQLNQQFTNQQNQTPIGTTTGGGQPPVTTQVTPPVTNPGYTGGNGTGGLPPVDLSGQLPGPGNTTLEPLQPPTPPNKPLQKIDPDPGTVAPTEHPNTTEQVKPEDQGYTDIQFSGGHKKPTLGGSEDANDGHDIATVRQAAQQLFQLGKFDQAASKYSKVAQMGGNTPRVQQQIGACFQHLGRADQSRTAYNKAINLYQSQIKLGHDVAINQRGLDTCEAALKALGG